MKKTTVGQEVKVKIFGLGHTREIAEAVCSDLGVLLCEHSEEKFPDGELKICTKESVKNSTAVVFHSLSGDQQKTLNDRLCELYFFLSHLKDKGAGHLTAVIPYLSYARSDQRKNAEDPLTLRYVAQLLEASGVNRVLSLDIHNIAAFENAFRCPVINVEAAPLFCSHVLSGLQKNSSLAVMSPDIGGIKRAEKFRKLIEEKSGLSVESALLEKFRTREGLEGNKLVGEVSGKEVIILDDMISTGGTILRAVDACLKNNCGKIKVIATHGLFVKNQEQVLNSEFIDEIIVTDSYWLTPQLKNYKKLKVLPCASLFSQLL